MTEQVNNKIYELLKQKNMTQKELAMITGLTESAISHYIKGDRVPRGVNLKKIADALNVTTDEILNIEYDYSNIKVLIARNTSKMNSEEKLELISILLGNSEDLNGANS